VRRSNPVRLLVLAATVAASSVTVAFAAAQQVDFPPRQERVPDFGRLVPEGDPRPAAERQVVLERVTTAVPWGRGMAMVDGELIVLSRGRHRGEGGVSERIVDHAGTLWRVDVSTSEPVVPGVWAGDAVRSNAEVFAPPTEPPFNLYRHDGPPEADRRMARPYCALAFDEVSRNLFVCAYAGAELSSGFRKHATDAVYRYDLRDRRWHVVEQHDPAVVPQSDLGIVVPNQYYPHHDPATNDPPHGWVNGPNGCIGVGDFLYVPAKDNHLLVQYDLGGIRADPAAGPPASRPVLEGRMVLTHPGGEEVVDVLGASSVGIHGDWLYLGFRTSSIVARVPLDEGGDVIPGPDGLLRGELIAVFEPWSPETGRSGNLYDLDLDASGELFVSMGRSGKIWRITPDPERPFYGNDRSGRPTSAAPFLDLSALAGRPTGCNTIYVDRATGYLYISSRNNDTGAGEIHGTIYRVRIAD